MQVRTALARDTAPAKEWDIFSLYTVEYHVAKVVISRQR